MAEADQGGGWWLASDGKWYPPDQSTGQAQGSAIPEDQTSTGQPLTKEGRVGDAINKWRRQLTDLGGMNNLLYYKDRKTGSLELSPGSGVDDGCVGRLIRGSQIRLGELFGLDPDQLRAAAKRARGAAKKAAENREERGLATLHLAWGMATWSEESGTKVPAAAVLLRPARLSARGGAAEDFDLSLEGDWSVSPTLLEALRANFSVDIDPEGLDDLVEAAANHGDAGSLFDRLAKLAADVPGFAVERRMVVSNFFYGNLAMVEDLGKSLEVMVDSTLICAIASDEEARDEMRAHQAIVEVPSPDYLPPADEFLVLDADASQSYVINAAVGGANLVVQGPPGTGKSQTIANLIASLSARGKRTLFVAEKRAAIDAVLKRLDGVGLGDLVLDLHDGSGSRSKVIADLDRALRTASSTPLVDYSTDNQELTRRRNELVRRCESAVLPRRPWDISAAAIFTELPGFDRLVRSDRLVPPGKLGAITPAVLGELQSDLERFIQLGGLPLVRGGVPWSEALAAGSVSTPESVRSLRNSLTDLREQRLPAAMAALGSVLATTGLRPPETLDQCEWFFALLSGVSTTFASVDPSIFGLDLDRLVEDLSPSQSGGAGRAWSSATNSAYRAAKRQLTALWRGPITSPSGLYEAVAIARHQATAWRGVSLDGGPPRLSPDLAAAVQAHEHLKTEVTAVASVTGVADLGSRPLTSLDGWLGEIQAAGEIMDRLPQLTSHRANLMAGGLGLVLADVVIRALSADQARDYLRYVWLNSVLQAIRDDDPFIGQFDVEVHSGVVRGFQRADQTHIGHTPQRIRRIVAERVTDARGRYPKESELLAKQARLKRKHLSIRQLRAQAPNVLGALKPCWAMSPLLVSQLLPPEQCFDVVVFDEASQVTPAGAVGALMRAGQAVVAGDPKQLPPTAFFATTAGDSDDEGDDELEDDGSLVEGMESILDVMGALLPPPDGTKTLEWHYRSRDERLIAFSNAQESLYNWSLTTFPGTSIDDAVSHVLVPFVPGVPEKTTSGTAEVARVVELVAEHARKRPVESLGIIGFGVEHANRIDEALRLARRDDEELDHYMASGRNSAGSTPELLFVKNLERVQGDERDAIILSVGYTKSADGRMLYRFGPINNVGGERRLNVATTRARLRMTVVSSFEAADMDPAKLNSEGPRMLQRLLAYAASGGTDLGPHSRQEQVLNPFERDVLDQLTAAGIGVVPQFGCSGYWIDFAAKHPERPGQMVLAIEADGAMYHSSPSARNRDRLRQEHLERLGWRFHRIWSQEWFLHREREVERVVESYRHAVEQFDLGLSEGPGAMAATDLADESSDASSRLDSTEVARVRRSGPCPVQTGWPISDYSDEELVSVVRWILSDTLLRTDAELLVEVMGALGFHRRGSRIVGSIEEAIFTARRRSTKSW